MLAADCSALPARLRHLIHVLALHADNQTGRGLSGQARLARYMGCSTRQLRRYIAELEAAWSSGSSPVGLLREGRFLNSDRYTLVIREDAPLQLVPDPPSGGSGPRVVGTTMSTIDRTRLSAMSGHPRSVERTTVSGQPPSEADTVGLQSTLFPSTEGTTEDLREQSSIPPGGAGAPAGIGEKPSQGKAREARRAAQLAASQRLAAAARAKLGG